MEFSCKKCDNCGKELRFGDGTIGSYSKEEAWIKIHRMRQPDGAIIPIGTSDICCDQCLVEWIAKLTIEMEKFKIPF